MLIGNSTILSKNPGRSIGGGATGEGYDRAHWVKPSMARGRFSNSGWDRRSGVPDGYRDPVAWLFPQKAGAINARTGISGSSTVTLGMAAGLNATASLTGTGDLTASLQLIVSMVAALTGSGDITNAAALAYLQLAANLAGSGSLAGTATALGAAAANLTGTGTLSGTTNALGTLAATINVTGDLLTTANVGDAVWGALAEAGFSYDQIIRIIAASTAGKVSGGPGSPVFRNLSDTQNQVSGTADSSGNRTAITYGS